MLRCKIDSGIESLEKLHQKYRWIPNAQTIRPSADVLEKKLQAIEAIDKSWMSLKDYILTTIFGREAKMICNRWYVPDFSEDRLLAVFQPNEFPYAIDEEGKHFVLWYGSKDKPCDDNQITADIDRCIRDIIGGSEDYDFAWYENPKMSVPDFYHVQVFWTQNATEDDVL